MDFFGERRYLCGRGGTVKCAPPIRGAQILVPQIWGIKCATPIRGAQSRSPVLPSAPSQSPKLAIGVRELKGSRSHLLAGQATIANRDLDYPTTGLGIRGMSA